MKVKDIMTKKVTSVGPETKVKDIAELLVKHDITGVPVVKNKKVIGIVTEADLIMQRSKIRIPDFIQLLEARIYLKNGKKLEEDLKKIFGITAKEVMTSDVVVITPEASVQDLATLIADHHINPVPVVKNDKLVGIVSRADIVKLLARPVRK